MREENTCLLEVCGESIVATPDEKAVTSAVA